MVADIDVEDVAVMTPDAITCPDVVCSTPESEIPATNALESTAGNVASSVKEPVLTGRSELNK